MAARLTITDSLNCGNADRMAVVSLEPTYWHTRWA